MMSEGECRDESERSPMMQAVRSENVEQRMFLKHITVDEGFTDSMASAYSQSVSASKASNERTWRYIYI